MGYDGPPFRWDSARLDSWRTPGPPSCSRNRELDAAFFHLHGPSRDDTAFVLDTLPIVRKNDERARGEYRTKRVILEIIVGLTLFTAACFLFAGGDRFLLFVVLMFSPVYKEVRVDTPGSIGGTRTDSRTRHDNGTDPQVRPFIFSAVAAKLGSTSAAARDSVRMGRS